jgi:hypothetical protein
MLVVKTKFVALKCKPYITPSSGNAESFFVPLLIHRGRYDAQFWLGEVGELV